MSDTFAVTMLTVLREPFEQWLRSRGLELVAIPDEGGALIAVPTALAGPLDGMRRWADTRHRPTEEGEAP